MAKLKVGDVLWFVPRESREKPREITIAKVGRVYADYEGARDRSRIRMSNMAMEIAGYGSTGVCYRDRSVYENKATNDRAWVDFCRRVDWMSWSRPESVTVETIDAAKKLLGIAP